MRQTCETCGNMGHTILNTVLTNQVFVVKLLYNQIRENMTMAYDKYCVKRNMSKTQISSNGSRAKVTVTSNPNSSNRYYSTRPKERVEGINPNIKQLQIHFKPVYPIMPETRLSQGSVMPDQAIIDQMLQK